MAKPPTNKSAARKSAKPKTVVIQVNCNGSASPDPARVYQNDHIVWESTDEDIQMVFTRSHPFDPSNGKQFGVKAKSKTQPYQVMGKEGTYKYNLVTSKGTFDPDVVVDPPPPGP